MSIQNLFLEGMSDCMNTSLTPEQYKINEAHVIKVREFLEKMLHPHSERAIMLRAFEDALEDPDTDPSLKKDLLLHIHLLQIGGDLKFVPEELKTLQKGYVMKPELEPLNITETPIRTPHSPPMGFPIKFSKEEQDVIDKVIEIEEDGSPEAMELLMKYYAGEDVDLDAFFKKK